LLVEQHAKSVVTKRGELLQCKHPTYVREIFKLPASLEIRSRALTELMNYMSMLPSPIAAKKHIIGEATADLYKKIINHSFVSFVFSKNSQAILDFYKAYEKPFETDGLFWLQMGLAYRGIRMHSKSLESLQKALRLYPCEQTEHALAQQLLILANEEWKEGNADIAESHLGEGVQIFEKLDNNDQLIGGRYYPIVALSEGHVFLTKTIKGNEAAKNLARNYFNILSNRLQPDGAVMRSSHRNLTHPQKRAKQCLKRLQDMIINDRWLFGRDLAQLMTTDLPVSKL